MEDSSSHDGYLVKVHKQVEDVRLQNIQYAHYSIWFNMLNCSLRRNFKQKYYCILL